MLSEEIEKGPYLKERKRGTQRTLTKGPRVENWGRAKENGNNLETDERV
jgi:hypothetical protein